MSIKTVYSCNLCGISKNTEELMQFYREKDGYRVLKMDDSRKSYIHLCIECIRSIKRDEIVPKE